MERTPYTTLYDEEEEDAEVLNIVYNSMHSRWPLWTVETQKYVYSECLPPPHPFLYTFTMDLIF
jgi:hypothetical protein